MNEIQFKAKRIDNGEWVKGFLLKGKRTYIVTADNMEYAVVSLNYMASIELIEVIPETVSQYIGLIDKNNEMIFKGDIVKFPDSIGSDEYGELYSVGSVEWSSDSIGFYFTNRWITNMEDFEIEDIKMIDVEIIGNIYDNPELL